MGKMEDRFAKSEGNKFTRLHSVGREEMVVNGELTRTLKLLPEETDRRRIREDRVIVTREIV